MIDLDRLAASAAAWAPVAVAAVATIVGLFFGLGTALLVVAGGVLVMAISLFWSSLGRLTGESPLTLEEAIGLGAPSPEEERKRSILRALKDLEFERSVGKISDADFAELSQRYRVEAKHLLQAIAEEGGPRRLKAEAQLAARLKSESEGSGARPKNTKKKRNAARNTEKTAPSTEEKADAVSLSDAANEDEAVQAAPESAEGDRAPESEVVCSKCDTRNDHDARFCKRCGATLATEEAS